MINDLLHRGLVVVFIGFNPSPTSSATGFPYAHRSNRFYRLLHSSGLTPILHPPSDNPHMLAWYGYGFTNIVARTTKRADEIRPEEWRAGRLILKDKLSLYKPIIACFVGKGVYQKYAERSKVDFGFQECTVLPDMMEFVAPGTSGLVRMDFDVQTSIYEELAKKVEELRKKGYRPPRQN
ncbi:mismatch-specific DNA-glycosylase [Alicyclobacillus tolerans]|uniref:TDG/mug DNA glycosylase family protein n=1 Tax=Alicyclobacillus tolerans TaxID=90970 RepID=A0ABT9LWG9_9BACL|nr:mismatch-specific DNA-glycosylase [Alicyclobacillus tengchongensis]MDP9728611.1 TDG/mug DNA glycosylase family protein [Alicyclobacillus tengchongensis]